MKKIIRLTESDLTRIIKRVINEQEEYDNSAGSTSEVSSPPVGCPSFDSPWYKNVYDMGFTATVGYQWEPALSKKMGLSKEAICSCFKANPNYGENSDEYYDMCA
jgi:hypothetical protein